MSIKKEIRSLSALETGRLIQKKEISSPEVTKAYLDAISEEDKEINSYITVFDREAMTQAEAVQKDIDSGKARSPLAGVPTSFKDNMCIDSTLSTGGAKMLEGFKPPYTATVVRRLLDNGAVVLGKTNLDEFAMGASTETSHFGVTKNPWDKKRVPGGSSGGSAASIAAELSPYSLGSDTGGSIRQPSAFCNLTGIKPTYGSVSRSGVMAYGSSLDQVGPIAKNAEDCAAVLEIISGYDKDDSTSIMKKPFDLLGDSKNNIYRDIKGMKIGIPKNYYEMGLDKEIKENILAAAKELEKLGAEVEETEIPTIEYAVPAFYIIACAEASSNLSRFDGVKYGFRSENSKDILDIYYRSRSEGFGTEVKRRIMLGAFVLSSGYFDAYYKKALQVRGLIKKAFDDAFSKYDIILSPVSPTPPYKIGEMTDDPLAMYLADIYTVSVNLSGLPSVALPCGFTKKMLPTGMQFIGKAFSENKLLRAAYNYQQVTDHHRRRANKGGEL